MKKNNGETKKRKGGKGKRKGSGFERESCKDLSLYITKGERKDIFGRSDSSGARFTQASKGESESQAGDFTYTHELGIPFMSVFCVECKSGYGKKKKLKDEDGEVMGELQKQWDLLDCIDSKQAVPKFISMWSQCEKDSILTSREPLLIFRRNLRSKCIVFSELTMIGLEEHFGSPGCKCIVYNKVSSEPANVYIMSLKDFFEWIPDISLYLNSRIAEKTAKTNLKASNLK